MKLKYKFSESSIISCVAILLVSLCSCKKMLEVPAPIVSTNGGNVYTNDLTAAAVLTGVYIKMSQQDLVSGGITSLPFYTGMSSDELALVDGIGNPIYNAYYTNSLDGEITGDIDFWRDIYPIIFTANSAIEGLSDNESLTPSVQRQLMGEAKFIRAFCYFYLTNLYGDVPLVTTSNYEVNRLISRRSQAQVYQQIIEDLRDAQDLLSESYLKADGLTPYSSGMEERVRPNKWAATALLSRAYLYTGDFQKAESEATKIIDNSAVFSLSPLNGVFRRNSTEAIWQLQPVKNGWNTEDAKFFILNTAPSSWQPVYLSDFLLYAFETGDNRKIEWIGKYTDTTIIPQRDFYYVNKYKINSQGSSVDEYAIVLRLAEQYLIRAEARAEQENVGGAQEDLNIIRLRAGLNSTPANDKASLLIAIWHERQVELFTEWGHRWLDLKRTNTIDTVMESVTPEKGGSWNSNWQWYPIPSEEIKRNPNLTQNIGY